MPPKIVISTFCQSRDQKSCRIPLEKLLPEITANLEKGRTGYREGVLLVPINPDPFLGQIKTLTEEDVLVGSYVSRVPGETPRKTIKVKGDQADAVAAVEVVLYSNATLAEKKENSDPTADYEVITILTKVSAEEQPMPPETLMANHFGDSGGTATNMTAEEFEAALKKSYEFWRNKAMIETLPSFTLADMKPGEFFSLETSIALDDEAFFFGVTSCEVTSDGKAVTLHNGKIYRPYTLASNIKVTPLSEKEARQLAENIKETIGKKNAAAVEADFESDGPQFTT